MRVTAPAARKTGSGIRRGTYDAGTMSANTKVVSSELRYTLDALERDGVDDEAIELARPMLERGGDEEVRAKAMLYRDRDERPYNRKNVNARYAESAEEEAEELLEVWRQEYDPV